MNPSPHCSRIFQEIASLLLMGQHAVVIVNLQVAVRQSKGGEITRAKHRKHV
jgi:hypothetical protein